MNELKSVFFALRPMKGNAIYVLANATNAIAPEGRPILIPLHDRKRLIGDDYSKIFRGLKNMKGTAYECLEAMHKKAEVRYTGNQDEIQKMLSKRVTPTGSPKDITFARQTSGSAIFINEMDELLENKNIPNNLRVGSPGRKSHETSYSELDKSKYEERLKKVAELSQKRQLALTLQWADEYHKFKSPWLNMIYEVDKSSKMYGADEKKRNMQLRKEIMCRKKYIADRIQKELRRPDQNQTDVVEDDIVCLISLLKEYYCGYSNDQLQDYIMTAFNTNKPLNEVIPLMFKHKRKMKDFLNKSEQEIHYPLNGYFKMTYWRNLKKYEERSVSDYFGEKVALYFALSNHFRDWLIYPSILGIGYAIVGIYYSSSDYYLIANEPPAIAFKSASILFVVLITFLECVFIFQWEQYEKMFSVRYGLTDLKEVKTIRTKFRGQIERSLITDSANAIVENKQRSFALLILSVFFFMLFTSFAIGICYTLLRFKRLSKTQFRSEGRVIPLIEQYPEELFLNLLELIRILIMDSLFVVIVPKIVSWQNLKYVEDMENQLSISMCAFQLINKSVYMVFLTFELFIVKISRFGPDKNGVSTFKVESDNCYHDSCYKEIVNFFETYSLFEFAWVFLYYFLYRTVIYRYFIEKLKKLGVEGLKNLKFVFINSAKAFKKLVKVKSDEKHTYSKATYRMYEGLSDELIKISKKDLNRKDTIVFAAYKQPAKMYFEVDKEIESQLVGLENYNKGDIDKSVFNYLSLVNNFTLVVLFGQVFAQSYIFTWLICLIQYYLVQNDHLYFSKRPNPVSANTVGIWLDFIKFISKLSILTNSYYIAFLVYQDYENDASLIILLTMTVCLSVLFFMCQYLMNSFSSSKSHFLRRSQYIKEKVFGTTAPKKAVADRRRMDINQKIFINQSSDVDSEIDDMLHPKLTVMKLRDDTIATLRFLDVAKESQSSLARFKEGGYRELYPREKFQKIVYQVIENLPGRSKFKDVVNRLKNKNRVNHTGSIRRTLLDEIQEKEIEE